MNFKYLRLAALIPLTLVLTQCDRVQSLIDGAPPKPTPYDFTFTIEMTPDAMARLKTAGDGLRVTAYFYGMARPEDRAKADEINRLGLGYQEASYSRDARKIKIFSHALDAKRLPQVVDEKPFVFLTVAAAGPEGFEEKNPDKMISCNGYTGPIDLAQAHPQVVRCEVYR